jgi:hypothetical protein
MLLSGLSARPERGIRQVRAHLPSLHATGFARYASKLQAAPASPAGSSRRLITAFHSPAATVPFRDHRGGVNIPGLSFQRPTGSSACPFGLWAPPPTARLTPVWSRSKPAARCRLTDPAASDSPRVSAPLWGFRPSGSLRSTRFEPAEPTSPRSPISFRSPPALLFITTANGSSLQARYIP